MPLAMRVKTPDEVLIYEIDWTDFLPSGVTVSSSSWDVPSGITNDGDAIINTNTGTQIQVSGGTDLTVYELENLVTLSNGEKAERTLRIRVEDK